MKGKIKKSLKFLANIITPISFIFIVSILVTLWFYNSLVINISIPMTGVLIRGGTGLEVKMETVNDKSFNMYWDELELLLKQKISERERLSFYIRIPSALIRYDINSKNNINANVKIVSITDRINRDSVALEYELAESEPLRKPMILECNLQEFNFKISHGDNWNIGKNFKLENIPKLIKSYNCRFDTIEPLLIPTESIAYIAFPGQLDVKITPSKHSYFTIFLIVLVILIFSSPQIREFIKLVNKGWRYFIE